MPLIFLSVFAFSILSSTCFNEIVLAISPEIFKFPKGFSDIRSTTDKSERFIVSEIVREKILERYKQEIPYSVEVVVDSFKDKGKVIVIDATIYVERESQKVIVLGKKALIYNQ